MGKKFCFRFDIDTPKCLREGVPSLMALSEQLGTRFTFFLSVGRSTVRRAAFERILLGARESEPSAAFLSARTKLGLGGYLEVAALNPQIGRRHVSVVRELAATQDMGLHGGTNHDDWHRNASSWTRERVERDIDWSLSWLRANDITVRGFSSPGWTVPENLDEVLKHRGFTYRADRHGVDAKGVEAASNGLLNLGTNILGEPGGVAYLEHMRALGKDDAGIRDDFRMRIRQAGDYAVVYDHPYYAGLKEIEMIRDLIEIAKDEGFDVVTMQEIADRQT